MSSSQTSESLQSSGLSDISQLSNSPSVSQALHSPLATPKATIETLQSFGLYTKKKLGQHFLIDDNVIGRILDAANLDKSDQVLEIGPGIGVLTVALLKQAGQVLALEYDSQLIEVLDHVTTNFDYSVKIVSAVTQADSEAGAGSAVSATTSMAAMAAMADASDLLILNEDALNIPQIDLPLQPTKLIANLPYQVAATNVLDCFEYLPSVQQATVMVQREVAERMAAEPGSKIYGAYSAKLQLLAQPVGSFAVSRNSFLPPPRVDSSVISLVRHNATESLVDDIEHYRAVAKLIDICFAQRRKTINNNLRAGHVEASTEMFQQAGIEPSVRAETLSPADFVRLYRALQ
ncbi:MAG: 16S rRNA (adenine(1518)-N(6)/adenine(1519)-N(6))-dimethyltransferase [Coriobacteriia bacterium]|nr:16S rRNA (adenine(1518)-N(6)/adenine(1519)-N(6))-dimethyltransferase [Coriobacteriia bacterium]